MQPSPACLDVLRGSEKYRARPGRSLQCLVKISYLMGALYWFMTAAQNKKLFRVLCTEGRPDKTGVLLAKELAKLDVPVKLLIDSAVAYSMDEVDVVFVGADGVVESDGVINMMGTYQIALLANSMNKPPVYVAAESYKFARLYPLDQKDLQQALPPIDLIGVHVPPKVEVERSARDYTPP
ncbi:hypothetical protein Bca52824_033277 [Brassica carinata]|uniref:Uncharacterized protein n=1 Tax=Brassica carinata TaxID=52824 RepID=A0A8X7V9A7_BRACI|nr:hypothetical protein Bca52824_033277 [Brassica carinata]